MVVAGIVTAPPRIVVVGLLLLLLLELPLPLFATSPSFVWRLAFATPEKTLRALCALGTLPSFSRNMDARDLAIVSLALKLWGRPAMLGSTGPARTLLMLATARATTVLHSAAAAWASGPVLRSVVGAVQAP